MSDPFVGEIRMFGGNFAPAGWAFCNGALMPISENETLFNLIGTTYGGDGQETFALPNLQSRVPLHVGPGFGQGQIGGTESVTLTPNQIPLHTHVPLGTTSAGSSADPTDRIWAANANTGVPVYTGTGVTSDMHVNETTVAGGSQPHDNMMPFLTISFIISLFGIFPSPT